jgi:hypothetical protein
MSADSSEGAVNLEDEIRRIEQKAREEVSSPEKPKGSGRKSRSRTLSKDISEGNPRNLEEEIQLIEQQARKETLATDGQEEKAIETPKKKSSRETKGSHSKQSPRKAQGQVKSPERPSGSGRRGRSRTLSRDISVEEEIRQIEQQAREETTSPERAKSSSRRSRSRTLSKDLSEGPPRNLEEEIHLIEQQARQESLAADGQEDEKADTPDKKGIAANNGKQSHSSSRRKGRKEDRGGEKSAGRFAVEPVEDEDSDGDDMETEDPTPKKDSVNLKVAATSDKKKKFDELSKESSTKNDLTRLIPGYTAPRKLNTSSLDRYRPTGGLSALQRQAEKSDKSTKSFLPETTKAHVASMSKGNGRMLPSSYTSAYASFKKGTKREPDSSAGAGWFGMKPTAITDEVKTDLAVIKNRNFLDPKRFYKSSDKFGSVLQVGTVIEGATEYYSSRLTKKQRRSNITEEIMADSSSADYARNKFRSMQHDKMNQAKKQKIKPKKGRRGF